MWSVAVFMLYFIISATLCAHCELPDSVVLAADGKVVFSSSFCRMTTCVPGMKIKVLMTVSFTTSCSFLCVLLRDAEHKSVLLNFDSLQMAHRSFRTKFCFHRCLNSWQHRFTKVLETLLRDQGCPML